MVAHYRSNGSLDLEQWEQVLAVNLQSVALCTQAAARQMIVQPGAGAIVNIASIESRVALLGHSHLQRVEGGGDRLHPRGRE